MVQCRMVLLATVLVGASIAWGQTRAPNHPLHRPVKSYRLSAPSFISALTQAAAEFRVPIGIEWIRSDASLRAVECTAKDTDVEGLLRQIVALMPGYELDTNHATVHVYPSGAYRDDSDFLNLKIHGLNVRDQYVRAASRTLQLQVRELMRPVVSMDARPHGSAGHVATGLGDKRVNIALGPSTVRDALDALLAPAAFKIWIVTYPASPKLTKGGFKRAESAFSPEPLPDDQQPVWDLLRWGVDPSTGQMHEDWVHLPANRAAR